MYTINKNLDNLLIQIELECREGFFNIEKFRKITFKLYTLNSNNYVMAIYDESQFNKYFNIIKIKDQYFISIEKPQLENLENGQLRYIVEYDLLDNHFEDETYSASDQGMIDCIITDRVEHIIIIEKNNGCC